MRFGVIRAGQTSWNTAEEACWKQDDMPELHNDNALWVFAMRVSEELRMLDCMHLNDDALYRLLRMGILNWEKPDELLKQSLQAVQWSAATSTRQVCQGHD